MAFLAYLLAFWLASSTSFLDHVLATVWALLCFKSHHNDVVHKAQITPVHSVKSKSGIWGSGRTQHRPNS